MSTLRTRIAGYAVVIEPATQEQIDSHKETAARMGWAKADYSQAVTAKFDGDPETLPYELRSTLMTVNAGLALTYLSHHVDELSERVRWTQDSHGWANPECGCEQCTIASRIFERTVVGRALTY